MPALAGRVEVNAVMYAKCWGVCAQQPTSLNGSLGTIPHTDSQSHISPPPHQPETQVHIHASQNPMRGSLMSGDYDQRC